MTAIVPSAYPRRPNPRGVADAQVMAGNDFADLAKAVNEAWAFTTPPLVHDTFEDTDEFLTTGHVHQHRYRFHSPWGLGVAWLPQIEVWIRRERPTTSGTWEVDILLNGVNQGSFNVPDQTAHPSTLVKLASINLDDTIDTHTIDVFQSTYTGLSSTVDFASTLLVITERDGAMTILPDTTLGVPFPRGVAFLPTDTEVQADQSMPVHMLVDMRSTMLDVFNRRQPSMITRSRSMLGAFTYRWLFDVPPLVEEVRAHVHMRDTSAGAQTSEIELTVDGVSWNPGQAPTPTGAWFSNDFSLTTAGPRRSMLVTLETIGDVEVEALSVYFLPV